MNHFKWGWCFSIHMIHKFSQDGLGTSNNYRQWLGQHEPCYDINTWPSLLDFLKASKARSRFWKAWASVLNTRECDAKALPHILKQMLDRPVKSAVYSLESNLINYFILINLYFTHNRWIYSLRHCQVHTNWQHWLPKFWFSSQYL